MIKCADYSEVTSVAIFAPCFFIFPTIPHYRMLIIK